MRIPGKYLLIILMVVLAGLCVALYAERQKTVAALSGRIAGLEASLGREKESCETRIALLKAEHAKQAREMVVKKIMNPLLDGGKGGLLKNLPADPGQRRRETIHEMVGTLGLSEEQEVRVRMALVDFEKAKRKVFETAKAEKRLFFEPRYLSKVNEARQEAMRGLGEILSAEQYKIFKEKGYDMRLGIRVMEAPVVKPQ